MANPPAASNKKAPQGRVPAYQRIEEDIRSKVKDGRLAPGAMLANRHNLAREYGVALSTAQQAIAKLAADGVLVTYDRRGTFVSHPSAGDANGAAGGTGAYAPPPAAIIPEKRAGRTSEAFSDSASLSGKPVSMTLGIVTASRIDTMSYSDIEIFWSCLAIRSLEQVFSEAGGATRYYHWRGENQETCPQGLPEDYAASIHNGIAAVRADGADAIAVVGFCDATNVSDEIVRAVDIENVPLVYISWHEVQPPLAQVFYDNSFAGYQAAQHLLRQGYQKLVFMVPFADAWITDRIAGARAAIRHAGLPEDTLRLYSPETPLETYDRPSAPSRMYEIATEFFVKEWGPLRSAQPCGIIAPNDDTGFQIMDAAEEQGWAPGRDFGLVGFDDDPRSCARGLTTVRPPIEAMGEEAGRLLLRALQGDKNGQSVRLRSHLIPRASTSLGTK
jgi:DNA-binding LacI/PurR family transcriptional regulator/ribosomal protein S25